MKLPEVPCVQDAQAVLGEGPVWDDATQRLWWVDIKSRLLLLANHDGQAARQWTLPKVVSGLRVGMGAQWCVSTQEVKRSNA